MSDDEMEPMRVTKSSKDDNWNPKGNQIIRLQGGI